MEQLTDEVEVVSAFTDPEGAARLAEEALAESAPKAPEPPTMEAPTDPFVRLPGGMSHPDHGVIETAEVRELTGADEERLSRVTDPARFHTTLLECGVEKLGDAAPTPGVLNDLLVGDREFLLMHIRIATFGKDIDVATQCPQCGEQAELTIDLTEIPVRTLENRGSQPVALSKGRTARVHLATGVEAGEVEKMTNEGATLAEVNTYLLGQCVSSIDGVIWMGASSAKELGLRDRTSLLQFLADNQPGPRFEEVTHQCEGCGFTATLPLSLGDLFRP